MDGIDQEINSCESAGEEGTPLPVIVLRDSIYTKQMKKERHDSPKYAYCHMGVYVMWILLCVLLPQRTGGSSRGGW